MKQYSKIKFLAVAVAAASLAACGGGSSSSSGGTTGGGSTAVTANLSANPSFVFDQTDYVGAVDPAATSNWFGFAMTGSFPTTAAAVDTSTATTSNFEPNVTYTPDVSAITPATDCPSISGSAVVTPNGTETIGGKTFQKCQLSGTILTDLTLTNDVVWSLVNRVNVGNGNNTQTTTSTPASVTLTINAGTVFASESGSSLVVTRGSEINAVGTEAQPIVMAGDLSNGLGNTGEWGGLVLQGYAYHNKCGDPATETVCNIDGEGAAGKFGGFNNADSSGTLQYVIVTEAGSILSNGDELNGIGFMGVGYGTTVDHIQVHGNADDGVEFFGGAVDIKNIILTANQDDSIDWDEGYVGNIQYAFILQTQNQNDAVSKNHAFELDTAGDARESAYQESNPTVANVTAIASLDATEATVRGDGIHLKEGSEGQFVNILLVGDYEDCIFLQDNTVETSYADINDAFVNVYASCGGNTIDAGTSGYTVTSVMASTSYEALDDKMATTAITLTSVPTIASKEIDGSAN
ncbi:MAG: hypothetical protein P1U57_10140 [Oleibacter sp.]|nr:hypothetical protein [Thalassolituus sp.]